MAYNNHPNSITVYFKDDQDVIIKFEEINEKIRAFRKNSKLTSNIKNIRNSVAGHIDGNFKKYFEIINKITTEETIRIGLDFNEILSDLMSFLLIITPKIRK